MDARCTIELFGELRLIRGGQITTRFRTHKAASLLAYLALNIQQTHPREKLIDLFWPDMDVEAGRDNLSTALSSLRRQLEPTGVPAGSILIADRQNVRLNPAAVTTDVTEFERRLRDVEAAETPADRAARLEKALEVYRGELLPGSYEDWTIQEQTRWSELFASSLLLLMRLRERSGDMEATIIVAQRILAKDPYREDAHRALMRCYARTGRAAVALETYRTLEAFLKRELGVAPAPETRRLAERIQNEPQTITEAPDESELFAAPSLTAAEPEIEAAPTPAVQKQEASPLDVPLLPLQLTRFFGRQREIARLAELITSGNRLVSILGPGGTGKTRIAIEVAGKVSAQFQERVWFVPLADIPDPGLIPAALIHALRLPPASNADPLERILEALGNAPCLFVLDNFEHLLRDSHLPPKCDNPALTGSPALVRMLLERLPGLSCLVTSRQALHLGGEIVFPLPALAQPEKTNTPEKLLECDSVALYIDRAQAVRPDFTLTATNADSVAELCRRLEGMPLAIEMAAAWARTLPPARVLERLERQLDLLVSRRRDLPPRHQSLRAAIEWSYGLLTPEQQACFSRLAVFRGGWTLDTAEVVCGTDALNLLDELQEQSLLIAEEREEETRYRMLAPLREYAAEKLEEKGDTLAAQRAHMLCFLAIAQEAAQHYLDSDTKRWLDHLDREHDNLRAALGWSLEHSPETTLRLGAALWKFWEMRGHIAEGRNWMERALDAGQDEVLELRADTMLGAGMLACRQGEYLTARNMLEQCLVLRQELGDRRGIAASLHSLGIVATQQGDYLAARGVYAMSLDISRELNDLASVAGTLNNLGNVAEIQSDFEGARRYHEESLTLQRDRGNTQGVAIALTNIGRTAFRQGKLEEAQDFQQQSLYLSRELGYKRVMRYALQSLGDIACTRSDFDTARTYYHESIVLSREIGFKQGFLESLIGLAEAASGQNEPERTTRLLGAAESLRLSLGITNPPVVQAIVERLTRIQRQAMGEGAFSLAYMVGRSLSLEAALSEAISLTP